MRDTHDDFHYGVTMHTDDLALIGCLRALSQHAQARGNARILWGGIKREDLQRSNHRATFHFSSREYGEDFLEHARRLLPQELWQVTAQRDDDPAKPQTA
jgi:hypothetical protein